MNQNFENNEFFQQLPEETKEKLRNCKSEEEAMDAWVKIAKIPSHSMEQEGLLLIYR